jgi:DNA-binding CsgD family transcriptional regulator
MKAEFRSPDKWPYPKNGKKLRDLKIDRVGQLCLQADEQGGCLTNVELALLLRTTPTTITKYIREYENKHDTILPRRGTIHDLGPTLTHKKEICRLLFLEGCSVIETCRRTKHSVQAVNRYITNFKQVLTCKTNGLSVEATAFATKLSQPLVKEYHRLFDEYAVTDQRIAKLIQSKH